jgi:hypothetical protein
VGGGGGEEKRCVASRVGRKQPPPLERIMIQMMVFHNYLIWMSVCLSTCVVCEPARST